MRREEHDAMRKHPRPVYDCEACGAAVVGYPAARRHAKQFDGHVLNLRGQ